MTWRSTSLPNAVVPPSALPPLFPSRSSHARRIDLVWARWSINPRSLFPNPPRCNNRAILSLSPSHLSFFLSVKPAALATLSMAPTILFVPGFWEGPTPFAHVSSLLKSEGFLTDTAVLPSTGTVSPGNPGMHDDVAAIRSTVEKIVHAEQDVVMACYSGGGFLGSNAIEGLTTKARADNGLKGGVSAMVFLSGALFPQGFQHGPLPFFAVNVCRLLFPIHLLSLPQSALAFFYLFVLFIRFYLPLFLPNDI